MFFLLAQVQQDVIGLFAELGDWTTNVLSPVGLTPRRSCPKETCDLIVDKCLPG